MRPYATRERLFFPYPLVSAAAFAFAKTTHFSYFILHEPDTPAFSPQPLAFFPAATSPSFFFVTAYQTFLQCRGLIYGVGFRGEKNTRRQAHGRTTHTRHTDTRHTHVTSHRHKTHTRHVTQTHDTHTSHRRHTQENRM
jgi:hypothetical protein